VTSTHTEIQRSRVRSARQSWRDKSRCSLLKSGGSNRRATIRQCSPIGISVGRSARWSLSTNGGLLQSSPSRTVGSAPRLERSLVALGDEGEIGRCGRKGHSSRGTPLSLPWARRAVSLPQASAARSRLTITCVARPRRRRVAPGAVSTAIPTAPVRYERSASGVPHPSVQRTRQLGPGGKSKA
jgi:hypothetical protein